MRRRFLVLILLSAVSLPAGAAPGAPTAQDRSVEPVVLKGAQFPGLSAGPDPTLREPSTPHNYDTGNVEQYLPEQLQSECYEKGDSYPNPYDPSDNGDHNCYQSSRLPHNPIEGAPVDRLIGYKWNGSQFEQIPFQVDERFTRYLTNNGSGFAFYSGTDAHNTYAFDREGFRFTSDESQEVEGGDPCLARPAKGIATMPDPVKGLDDDDELAFMYSDAGEKAPIDAPLPSGIASSFEVAVADPSAPDRVSFAYVALADEDGPRPAFDATNGYVRYERDANADLFVYSQSSYGDYGAAPKGPYCKEDGTPDTSRGAIAQRRPLDRAWVKTPRYHFRYDGRWLMTQLRVSGDDSGLSASPSLGQDLIDQWKARAFQQRPGGKTPCCGYEEEVNNWGGSSILMGERAGPVRAIRAAWGADSSTNNIRTETFYRDDIRFGDSLRVHVIPPFDGIYVQWDHTAGVITKYYNPMNPDGVDVDGKDDEIIGNSNLHIAQDRIEVQDGEQHVTVPLAGGDPNSCDLGSEDGICNDVDSPDPLFSGPLGNLDWEQVSGNDGTLVTRWTIKEHTAGDAYSLIALPYYRDDACFDDGTGSDPGPHLRSRNVDNGEFATWTDENGDVHPRECWSAEKVTPEYPTGHRRWWQGSIGTHGLHLQLIADSDNAMLTAPVDEIVSEQRMVVLQGDPGNVGETYGRHIEYPLTTSVAPFVTA